jgi:hypothetical protein
MREARDTWPPRIGQRVWVVGLEQAADVLELLPDEYTVIEVQPTIGRVEPSANQRRVVSLGELRPEYPHLVPEWPGTPV